MFEPQIGAGKMIMIVRMRIYFVSRKGGTKVIRGSDDEGDPKLQIIRRRNVPLSRDVGPIC